MSWKFLVLQTILTAAISGAAVYFLLRQQSPAAGSIEHVATLEEKLEKLETKAEFQASRRTDLHGSERSHYQSILDLAQKVCDRLELSAQERGRLLSAVDGYFDRYLELMRGKESIDSRNKLIEAEVVKLNAKVKEFIPAEKYPIYLEMVSEAQSGN